MTSARVDPLVFGIAVTAGAVAALLGVSWPYVVVVTLATLVFHALVCRLPRLRPRSVSHEVPEGAHPTPPPQRRQLPGRARGGPGGDLTPAELAVAVEVGRGLTDKEIAHKLTQTTHRATPMSPKTVETHIGNIKDKLGVEHRVQIGVWAERNGYLDDADIH